MGSFCKPWDFQYKQDLYNELQIRSAWQHSVNSQGTGAIT